MKKTIFLLLIFSSAISSFAQQATELDPKFVKLPRYADLPAITSAIPIPQQGMQVYNIATASNWYYNGTDWINMSSSGSGGGLSLPYNQSQSSSTDLFSINNTGTGSAAVFQGTKALETNGGVKLGGESLAPAVGKQLTSIDADGTAQWRHLIPKLSSDAIDALASPQVGDLAYDLTFKCLKQYNGTKWVCTFQNPDLVSAVSTAWREGGSGVEYGSKIATDASGNIYIVGVYNGISIFGSGTPASVALVGPPLEGYDYDTFVAKYNNQGVFQWVRTTAGTSSYGNDIAVDNSGNIYITGGYYGNVIWGNGTATQTTLTATSNDIYLAKYTTNGDFVWVKSAGGTGNYDVGNALVTDAAGNIFVTGTFQAISYFGTNYVSATGTTNVFVAKYNSEGTNLFVVSPIGYNGQQSNAIAIDTEGMVYITGKFQSSTLSFGGISISNPYNFGNMFVTKMNNNGVWQWAKSAGGSGDDHGSAIKVNTFGAVIVAGFYNGIAYFTPSIILDAGQNGDIFLANYASIDGTFNWCQKINGIGLKSAESLATDNSGNFLVTGSYQGDLNLGNRTINNNSFDYRSMFLAKYNANGGCIWEQHTTGDSFGMGLAIGLNDNIFNIGYYKNSIKFGSTSLSNEGNYDIFIGRFKE